MWDELRDRISQLLASGHIGVVCAQGVDGPCGTVVRYWSNKLTIACLLPYWSDVLFAVEERPQVLLLMQFSSGYWVQYQGLAQLVAPPDYQGLLPDDVPISSIDRCVVAYITPKRIDLLHEASLWSVQETLEI